MKYLIVKNTKIVGVETHKFDTTSEFGEWVEVDDSLDIPAGSTWVDNALVLPDPPSYSVLREREYPSYGEQFDMQYHDQLNGTSTWKDAIETVKTKYPKS